MFQHRGTTVYHLILTTLYVTVDFLKSKHDFDFYENEGRGHKYSENANSLICFYISNRFTQEIFMLKT